MSSAKDSCPSTQQLSELLAGHLAGPAGDHVRAHVEDCPVCQGNLESMVARAESELARHQKQDSPSASEEDFLRTLVESAPPPNWDSQPWLGHPLETHRPLSAVLPPQKIPGYEILDELGRGGMGVVYKARQIGANRIVALKMILSGEHARAEDRLRFRTEAEAPARLRHPNIIQVYEVGEHNGRPYFSMEFADGLSLADHLGRMPQPAYASAEFLAILADAIHYAHSQGVIHRDLKPGNILLQKADGERTPEKGRKPDQYDADNRSDDSHSVSPDRSQTASDYRATRTGDSVLSMSYSPKISDFGLARRADDPGQTRTGTILGTPSYMAPEQARGTMAGPLADVYSLGAILYELLTGRPPFIGKTLPETMLQVQQEDPVPPHRLQPGIPLDLETICLKCLEKDPQRRYATARELALDLRHFLNDEPVLARPPSLIYQWGKFARRYKLLVAQAAALFLLLVLAVVFTTLYGVNEAGRRAAAEENSRQTELARQAALSEAYQARVLAAQATLLENDPAQTARHLEAAPESFRGWEWAHLKSRLDESNLRMPLPPELRWWSLAIDSGRWLAVASEADRVVLWDVTKKQQVGLLGEGKDLRGFPLQVPQGLRILLSGPESPPRLVDPQGKTLQTYSAKGPAYMVAANTQGTTLAICFEGQGNLTYFFDVASGQQIARWNGNGLSRMCMAFHPDGETITSGDSAGFLVEWNLRTQRVRNSFPVHLASVRSVAYSKDGKRLLTAGSDLTFRQFDAQSSKPLDTRYMGAIANTAIYSPDGRFIATDGVDRAWRIWSADGGEQIGAWPGHTSMISNLAYSPDGAELATLGTDAIRLWKIENGAGPRVLRGHDAYVYPVAYSPDGRWIASGGWDYAIRFWDAATGSQVGVLRGHQAWIASLVFSRDSKRLYSLANDATVRTWEVASGTQLQTARKERNLNPSWTYNLAISPDGRTLATLGDNGLSLSDPAGGGQNASIPLPVHQARLCAFSPDGNEVAVVAERTDRPGNDSVFLVDLRSRTIRLELGGRRGRIHALAYNPRGGWLASGGEERAVHIWDMQTGALLHDLHGHFHEIFAIAVHPDGTRLASAGRDRIIRLWDPQTEEQVLQMRGHTDYVYSLAFSPDGGTLVSGSGDTTVRLWDTFPIGRRHDALKRLEARRGEAAIQIDRLLSQWKGPRKVAEQLEKTPAGDPWLRRAVENELLRRATQVVNHGS